MKWLLENQSRTYWRTLEVPEGPSDALRIMNTTGAGTKDYRAGKGNCFPVDFGRQEKDPPPKDSHVLYPRTFEPVRFHSEGEFLLQMELRLLSGNLEMGRLSWVI